jgi:hypothetical protein
LTSNNLFFLGVLGKPHALNGFLYLNQDIYFRTFDLTGINVFINGNSFKIQKFKTHLKNRYLIKFEGLDSISDIEAFRNQNIYISSEQINTFISNGLPWPGFFIGKKLNDKYIVKNYFYADKLIYLTIDSLQEVVIPFTNTFLNIKIMNLI